MRRDEKLKLPILHRIEFLHSISISISISKSTKTKRSSSNTTKQGLYEDLEHVIAAGFDPKGDAAQLVHLDWDAGGL